MILLSNSFKTIFLALILTTFIIGAWFFQQNLQSFIISINSLGHLAPVLFILIYCLATVVLLPTMVLTLAGGAIFGPVAGTVLNLFGATLGAGCAFLISRYLAYNWFEQRRGKRLRRLIKEVDQRGWQCVAVLRLFPIVPFNLVNYGLGITDIGFKLYMLTTLIFLLPAEIIYTYCGYAGIHILNNPEEWYKNTGVVIIVVTILLVSVFKIIKNRRISIIKRDEAINDHSFD